MKTKKKIVPHPNGIIQNVLYLDVIFSASVHFLYSVKYLISYITVFFVSLLKKKNEFNVFFFIKFSRYSAKLERALQAAVEPPPPNREFRASFAF